MFAFLRRFFARLFGRSPPALEGPRVMNIPAPFTLVNRIDRLTDEERDMLRIAEEAMRRGFPEQARTAYWKAARFYLANERPLKAIAVLSSIVRIAPNDIDAWVARGQANVTLDRRRDAALAYYEAANILESAGDGLRALELLEACIDLDPDLEGLALRYRRLGGQRDVWTGRTPLGPDGLPLPGVRGPSIVQPRAPSAPLTPDSMPDAPAYGAMASRPARPSESLVRGVSVQSGPVNAGLPAARPASAMTGAPARGASQMSAARAPLARAPSVHDEIYDAVSSPVAVVPGIPTLPTTAGTAPAVDPDAGPIELDLGMPEPASERPTRPATRPFVPRFSIPDASTKFEDGLPSALVGSEHEQIARTGDVQVSEGMGEEPDTDGDIPIPDARTAAYDSNELSKLLDDLKGKR